MTRARLTEVTVGLGQGFGPKVRAYLERARTRPSFVRAMQVDAQAPAFLLRWHPRRGGMPDIGNAAAALGVNIHAALSKYAIVA